MVVDHECMCPQDVKLALEDCGYVYPTVMEMQEREVEWTDDHPLNFSTTSKETFKELFSDEGDRAATEYNRAIDQQVDFD